MLDDRLDAVEGDVLFRDVAQSDRAFVVRRAVHRLSGMGLSKTMV